jgi:hypothetical protein
MSRRKEITMKSTPNTSKPAVPARSDEEQTTGAVKPAATSLPRNGTRVGLNGNPDPLNLGRWNADTAPSGVRSPR